MQIKLTSLLFFKRKAILKFIVKTLLFLCCTSVFGFSTSVIFSQNEKVTIDSDRTLSIYEVLELIGHQTECTFIYQSDIFKDVPNVSVKKGVIKVKTLLKRCLPESDFDISISNDTYISISRKVSQKVPKRQTEVKGQVTDSTGLPIAGVFVLVKGTNLGTSTSIDGTYSIRANATDTLVFSYLGFVTQNIPVDGRQEINVQLQEDITQLDAVTLNAGYYSVKERESTGSIVKVSEKDIVQQSLTNPLASIQGRAAGVEISQTSGIPGADFNIRIRGQNSIRTDGNDPLYIVDGVPFSSSSLGSQQTSTIMPGRRLSPLNNINSADIASIEILKDADATAIYGSRGANGVVLITTKKGHYGDTKFTLNTSAGFGSVANRIDVLSTPQYLEMRREAFANDGIDPLPFNAYDINGTWDETRDTDWQDELFGGTAYLNTVQGALSGGNEQTQFLISGNYNKQTTVYPGDFDNKKISVLSNLSHTSKNDKLSLQFSANYTSDINNLLSTDLVSEGLRLSPNAPRLYDDNGELNWENSTWNNPLRLLEGKYKSNGSALISNLSLNYKLTDGFNFVANMGYTESHLKEIRTVPSTVLNPAFGLGSEISSAIHSSGDRSSWIVEPQLHWNTSFGDTEIKTLAGLTFQEQGSNQLSQVANGFTSNGLIENIGAASTLFILNDIETKYRYNALFGRINLNHNGKYILNLTGRRDGSSRFGPNKRFSNFGAIGMAWIFSEERFIKDLFPFLSFGKLRASYGTSGNDQIGDYQYLDTYSFGNSLYDDIIGLSPTRLFNPNYSWEENKKGEVALELGFLNDRIFINGGYYSNRSSNQLVGIPLPGTTGFNSLNANLNATVQNSGWEISINTSQIQKPDLKWSTSFNLTIPKIELLEFPNLEGSTFANQLVAGEPLNIVKVFQSQGVNPETGYYEFTDFNNDGVISAPDDNQIVKNLNPEFFGGISNQLSYKRFSLDFLFQFTKQIGRNYLASSGIVGGRSNQPTSVLQRWQNPGDTSSIQQFTSGANQEGSMAYSSFIESDAVFIDASFIRLRTVSLTYRIPQLERSNLNCEVFLNGQNLLTFTKYDGLDPETRSSSALPPLRFISLGTKITF